MLGSVLGRLDLAMEGRYAGAQRSEGEGPEGELRQPVQKLRTSKPTDQSPVWGPSLHLDMWEHGSLKLQTTRRRPLCTDMAGKLQTLRGHTTQCPLEGCSSYQGKGRWPCHC